MKLPDGTILMHEKAPYDPVKAHEYYMRTRKLKGLKGKGKMSKEDLAKYQAARDKFLGSLPMAVEGASLKKTADFVKGMLNMSDSEMVAKAARIKKTRGNHDGAQVATINVLLKNRARVRQKTAKKIATTNGVVKEKVILPPSGKLGNLPTLARPANTTKN